MSIDPESVPSRSNARISSSTSTGSSGRLRRANRSKASVERVRMNTSGEAMRASTYRGRASAEAKASGRVSAMRLGTSSPRMSEK